MFDTESPVLGEVGIPWLDPCDWRGSRLGPETWLLLSFFLPSFLSLMNTVPLHVPARPASNETSSCGRALGLLSLTRDRVPYWYEKRKRLEEKRLKVMLDLEKVRGASMDGVFSLLGWGKREGKGW